MHTMAGKGICFAALICALALVLAGCSQTADVIHSTDDINRSSFSLGVATGSHSQLEAEERFPDCDMQYFTSVTDGCAAVKAGKLDGFMFDTVYINELCRTDSELTAIDEKFVGSDVAFGLAKCNRELCDKMSAVIEQLRADGTLDDMQRRWIDGEDRTMPELEKPENTSGKLSMLTEALGVPFCYIADDGVCLGMEVELGMRIAYALGMDFEIQMMNFDGILSTLVSSTDTLIVNGLTVTEERKQQMLFTEPYYTSSSTVLVRKDRYVSSSKTFYLSDSELTQRLSNSRLGALSGTTTEKDLRIEYPDAEVKDYASVPDALAALSSGRIDYAVVQDLQALKLVNTLDDYRICTNPVYVNPVSFAVSKSNTALLDRINEAIKAIKDDGTLDDAYASWTSGDYTTDDIPHLKTGDVLKVALSTTAEPLHFMYNNEIVGYDCEVIERVAYMLGMRVEYLDVAFSEYISAVVSGKADVAVGLTYSEERAKQIAFSDPYNYINIEMVELKNTSGGNVDVLDSLRSSFIGTFITENRWKLFVSGMWVTISVSVCAYLLATVLGLVLCAMKSSRIAPLRGFAAVYCKLSTGIPVLVWLMILYYMVFRGVDIPGILVAIIGFGMVGGASLSGIFKTGLDSIDKGQIEASSALGFMPFETFRRIILPQAAGLVFDLYKGDFVSLVKSTSIVGYIAIMDLTKVSDIVRSRTYQAFFPLITTALIYFAITAVFIWLLGRVQRHLNPRLRKNVLKGVRVRGN